MMVACPKCTLNNTLDSLFCRKCGATLPVSVIEEEQEKLKEIVIKGMSSFEAGKTEEAMMIADHAVMANPSYADAFALKGMVHERKGEYAEALDSYETVVALNPDSTIDKIKLNQLRNAFAQKKAGAPSPDKKVAALMAIAATLLIGSVGFATVRLMNSSGNKTVPVTTTNTTRPIISPPNNQLANTQTPVLNNTPSQPVAQNQAQGNSGGNSVDDVQPIRSNGQASNQSQPERTRNPILPNQGQRTRSTPTGGRGGNNEGQEVRPLIPNVGEVLPPQNNSQPVPEPGGGGNFRKPQPNGDPPTRPVDQNQNEKARETNAGVMEVSISKGNGKPKGNPEADTLQKTGNERMKAGDADGAAKAYEGANRAGSSSGKNHQRQAQALARQGKNSEAQAAYQRAISAYQSDIQSGKGNRDSNEAGLASCRAALKQLG
jgi:tetratricopeptide (TPR) repeat protein